MRFFSLIFLFISVIGCGRKADVFKVAVLLPLSGEYSSYGKDANAGIEFFLKKQKDIPFEVKIFDFKSDSELIKKKLEEISKDKRFLCIVGPLTSRFSLIASRIAEKKAIPLITPTATNPEITKNKKWIFRMIYSDEEQGRVLAKFVRKYLGLERAGIIYIREDVYSSALAQFFKETFEKENGKVIGVEEFGDDIDSRIISLKKTNPQVLFIPLYADQATPFVKKCINNKFTPLFIGGDGLYSAEFIEEFRNYFNKEIKVFISSPFHPDRKIKEIRDFVDEFEIEYGKKPDFVSALSYDAMLFIRECFKNKNINSRGKLLSFMENIKKFVGATGKYLFEKHTPGKKIWILKASKDGFETVLGIGPE